MATAVTRRHRGRRLAPRRRHRRAPRPGAGNRERGAATRRAHHQRCPGHGAARAGRARGRGEHHGGGHRVRDRRSVRRHVDCAAGGKRRRERPAASGRASLRALEPGRPWRRRASGYARPRRQHLLPWQGGGTDARRLPADQQAVAGRSRAPTTLRSACSSRIGSTSPLRSRTSYAGCRRWPRSASRSSSTDRRVSLRTGIHWWGRPQRFAVCT